MDFSSNNKNTEGVKLQINDGNHHSNKLTFKTTMNLEYDAPTHENTELFRVPSSVPAERQMLN